MSFHELCELAEKELQLGIHDARLLERARAQAKGVAAHAQQIYWRLRATALQEGGEIHVRNVVTQIAEQERRLRSRKSAYRWFWATACVVGALGAVTFPILMVHAAGKPRSLFWFFLVLSVASLALAGWSFIASKYHTHIE